MTPDPAPRPIQFVVLPGSDDVSCADWTAGLADPGDPEVKTWQPGRKSQSWPTLLEFLRQQRPDDGLMVVRSGLILPADWRRRLTRISETGAHLPWLPAGNYADMVNPVAGLKISMKPEVLDDWLWLCAEHRATPIDEFPLDCLYLPPGAARALAETTPALLLDSLFVYDPDRALDAGQTGHPAARAALGPARLRLQRLNSEKPGRALPRPGRDEKPVTLHISHDWGGGIPRWIGDLINADRTGHHLVLSASGDPNGTVHGQSLHLYAAGPGRGLVQEWTLSPAIADTVGADPRYRERLHGILRRFGVGRIIVSSLIGHSLDALETGLPTAQILHDHYPLWPLLDRDPLDWRDPGGRIDLERALSEHGSGRLFQPRPAAYWREIGSQWLQRVQQRDVGLIAPSFGVLKRWQALAEDRLAQAQVIGHGFSGWQKAPPQIDRRARKDGRLNLVVVGRLTAGKGLKLLRKALPELQELAHLTLIGCGRDGLRFLGRRGVDLIFDYEREALPELLAGLAPQAALFLSTVPETWSYTLSELRSLGLIPIATRLGSFEERIESERDGWLFDPEPGALVELLTRLHRQPPDWTRLQTPASEPSTATVVQRYWRLIPAAPTRTATAGISPAQAVSSGLVCAELADGRHRVAELERKRARLEAELAERADWARRYERLSTERTQWAQSLEDELKREREVLGQLTASLETLEAAQAEALAALNQTRSDLESTREELQQNKTLQQHLENSLAHTQHELALVLSSRSWRLTRPLRFGIRALSQFKQRRAWNPLIWPRLMRRLIHSLRFNGLRGTLQLAQGSPAPAATRPSLPPVPVPEESAELTPVRLPCSDQPLASIIIPVYNKLAYTAACLQSLAAEAGPTPFEVIVVDDCSSDGSADYLAECEGVVLIRNSENSGFIASCNAGAAKAGGDYLVFLNNDTTVTSGWLEALLATFDDFADVGVVGARLVYPDGHLQEAGGIVFSDGSGWNYGRNQSPDEPQYNFAAEADYVSGACLALPRELFEELQGFDRHYAPAYYEDTDLCFRVRQRGLRVFCQPACTIVHHEGVSSGTDESSGTKRYQAVNREKFRERWGKALAAQPPHRIDSDRRDPVRRARFHRARGRVLAIDATTPMPDHDSGSVRLVAMLELMTEAGWQVTFMPQNLNWEGSYTEALQQRGIEVLTAPAVRALEPWLSEHGADLDLVLVSRHYVLEPVIKLLRKRCRKARIVFDTVDLHFLREQRQADLSNSTAMSHAAERTRRTELGLMLESDVTLVVSPTERDLLAEQVPEADVRVLSNIHHVHGRQQDWAERRDLLFVGGFQHPPNVDAAEWLIDDIFPRLRRELPGVQLHLIGSRMPEALRERAGDGVLVHGFVEDLTPYLNNCRLSLAPLRYGAGVKGKVNQAMAWGLPVVATRCASEGMFLRHGEDVLVADDAAAFVAEVVRAYQDEALWHQLSDGGLANVEQYFSRAAAGGLIRELLAGSPKNA